MYKKLLSMSRLREKKNKWDFNCLPNSGFGKSEKVFMVSDPRVT
jgi:hypothetical protein